MKSAFASREARTRARKDRSFCDTYHKHVFVSRAPCFVSSASKCFFFSAYSKVKGIRARKRTTRKTLRGVYRTHFFRRLYRLIPMCAALAIPIASPTYPIARYIHCSSVGSTRCVYFTAVSLSE